MFAALWTQDGVSPYTTRSFSAQQAHFDGYEGQFVSSYATSNIEEDFAETLAFGMLGDRTELGTRANEKILRVLSFAPLNAYRTKALTAISNW